MTRSIVFVAGIHGVGKTSFCQLLANRLSLEHTSASTLIKRAKQQDLLHGKAVENVSANQDVLITALTRYHWSSPALLLDGHFCLLTTERKIQPIPLLTFRLMHPSSVILLVDEEEVIQQRLQERDQVTYPLDFLVDFQLAERNHAQTVCQELAIPLLTTTSDNIAEAAAFTQRVISG
jgi:adenylate kinase